MIERYYVNGPSDPQWHDLRSRDVTASILGAIAGVDPHKSKLQVFLEKAKLVPPQPDNDAMQRGRWLEPAVVNAIRETFPAWEVGYPLGIYIRDSRFRLGCTPDAVAQIPGEPGMVNLQLKVVSAWAFEREWLDHMPPMRYQLQTACETMLTETESGMVAALVIDQFKARLHIFDIPRVDSAEAKIKAIAMQFWDDIEAGRQPPVDYRSDHEVMNALYPISKALPPVDLSTDNILPGLLEERDTAKATIRVNEARVSEIDTEIKSKMAEAERATLPGWAISWKTQYRKETVIPAGSYRPLRVTKKEQRV